jgi:hypothetical protein
MCLLTFVCIAVAPDSRIQVSGVEGSVEIHGCITYV